MENKNLKKEDMVQVLVGRDKGKTGKIIDINADKQRVIISGINYIKKHERPNPKNNDKGGIIQKEASIALSNVMLFCGTCKKGRKTSIEFLKDGSKIRKCKKCGDEIGK